MRYFLGFLVTIGLLIAVILMIFGGGDDAPKVDKSSKPLSSYATSDSAVQLTIDGKTNANQLHQQVRIIVERDEVIFEIVNGYEGDVVKRDVFASNENAYATFLRSLSVAGFTKVDPDSKLKDDRGYCSLGTKYIFQLRENDEEVLRSWASTCKSPRTFLGNLSTTLELFENQVPEFDERTQELDLNM